MRMHPNTSILIVEDNPGHARLIEKNLRRSGINNRIIKLENGQEALDLMFGEGDCTGQPRPSPLLVLLDLNMPVMDGFAVLERMKKSPDTKRIPVIILTTTDEPREIHRCYELGANIYITKPVKYEDFVEAVKAFGSFFEVIAIPDDK
ncbi:MAG: response regulator [Gammaproteobacteria bacterium]|nr:response regulator [Gammaproteobacteria bacterium]